MESEDDEDRKPPAKMSRASKKQPCDDVQVDLQAAIAKATAAALAAIFNENPALAAFAAASSKPKAKQQEKDPEKDKLVVCVQKLTEANVALAKNPTVGDSAAILKVANDIAKEKKSKLIFE